MATVICLDPIDLALILELSADCRRSYQAIARKLKLAPNSVKNRITKLHDRRVLLGFGVIVSMEMLGAEHVAGYIMTNGSENVIDFMKQTTSFPGLVEIYRTGDMRYEYWAMVSGASETLGFERFLQDFNDVTEVEMRPIEFFFPNMPSDYVLNSRGKKVTFTRSQLRVLRCLYDDGRMPVAQIVKQTGFTARRVRKILRELKEGGGVHFTTGYDIFALGDMEYRLKLRYDNAQASDQDIIIGVYEKYPNAFLWASITTNEPLVDIGFIIDRPGAAIPIINEVKTASYTRLVEDYISYPRVVIGNNPLRVRLAEILLDTGLLDEDSKIRGITGKMRKSSFSKNKKKHQF